MQPTFRLVFITAFRDRLFPSFLALLVVVFSTALLIGGAAVYESQQSAAVLAAGVLRLIAALGATIFAALHVQRLFETREIETIVSRAISRPHFVLAYWLALAAVMSLILLPGLLLVIVLAPSNSGVLLWSLSLVLEMLIVTAFTLFAGLTFETALPTVAATFAFYGLSRMMSFFTAIAVGSPQNEVVTVGGTVVRGLSYVLPRLDLFGQTRWLVYGTSAGDGLGPLLLQTVLYSALLICAAMFDLRRKQF